jgi:thioesterase domain-containing protein/acyl carrier protein
MLVEMWRKALAHDAVGLQDDFFALGGDSVAASHILTQIHEAFGCDLPLHVFWQAPTVQKLARILDGQARKSERSPLVPLQPKGSRPPFFLVHGVGGSVGCFAELARHFTPDQPLYGVQAACPPCGEHRFRPIEELAAVYLEAVCAVQPKGSYHLGGFSFGGSVALEMAQLLLARGRKVALLAIVDHTPSPQRYRRFVWSPRLPLAFAVNAFRWLLEDLWRGGAGPSRAGLLRKARVARKQLSGLLRRPDQRSGQTDVEEVFGSETFPERFRSLLEMHYQALRAYLPKAYPGRVALFRALVRPLLRFHGHDLGWGALAGGGVEVVCIPGNHETLLKEPHVRRLAEALQRSLTNAQCGQ